mmetsp:Transcript_17343/g.31409  ORF Transcript_17343/g.31409 Transcript_17343/m.31409 type:complete len:121 (-) Transcript_17343:50-412(-)
MDASSAPPRPTSNTALHPPRTLRCSLRLGCPKNPPPTDTNTIDQVASDPMAHQLLVCYLDNDTLCYWADPTKDRVAWDGWHTSLLADLLGLSTTDLGAAHAVGRGDALLLSHRSEGNRRH